MSACGLEGRVALVTGASSGIGAASARALAANGAEVFLVARRESELEDVAASITSSGGVAHVAPCDISGEDAGVGAVTRAVEAAGGLQILVHSAGLYEAAATGEDALAGLDRMYRTNVRAPFAMTEAALPHLGRGSSIVFVSSICAFTAFPLGAAYSTSKGAVSAMVAGLAVDLGPRGIRANAVAPGEVQTPMNAPTYEMDPTYLPRMIAATPLRMAAEPEDIASVVAFLAGDGARFVTGETVVADGGLTVTLPGFGAEEG